MGPEPREGSGLSRAREGSRERLLKELAALKAATEPEESRRAFAELSRSLNGLSREAASAAVSELLDSGADAPSHLDFEIGPDGFLTQASSLRVFLLDRLAQIDPTAGASYAEKILGSFNSPDEWAVSLRNYALGNPTVQARTFLLQKFLEMVQHEPWLNNPSTGFLEAFDVAAYLGGTDLMPALTQLVRKQENRAVVHAAYLALDRLAISKPVDTLVYLLNNGGCMAGREQTRANYFARANTDDPNQRKVLESYLLEASRPDIELQTFAGLFPNGNYMVSHNLLTSADTPDHNTLIWRDRQALKTVEEWLIDPRFAHLVPHLQLIRARLEYFTGQAAQR